MDDETIRLGVDATPQFIGALMEMVWAQIGTFHPVLMRDYLLSSCRLWQSQESVVCVMLISCSETVGQDLEAFAK